MKLLLLFLLSLCSIQIYAEDICTYNCPSLSLGYVGTFGNIHSIVENGSHLSLGFTPKYGMEFVNQKIGDTNIVFLKELKLSFSAEWYHLTGPLLNRQTDYYAPMVHLNYRMNSFMGGQINSSIGMGYGDTEVSRTGYSGNSWSPIYLAKAIYERPYKWGVVGVGAELGTISNSNYPINHYGLLLKYGRQF
jgi:hypothetical protein